MTSALFAPPRRDFLRPKQIEGVELLHRRAGRAGLFMGLRTGKTRTALTYLTERGCSRVLVVGPLTVASVWAQEAAKLGLPYRVVNLTELPGATEKTRAVRSLGDQTIAVVNYESYWREPLRAAILGWAPDAIVLDEAHRIRHRGTRQSRFAHILADKPFVQVRLALTGTPINNGLEDAWSLYRFIDRDVFGRRYADFAAEYLTMGGYQSRQVVGHRNVERAHGLIAETSFQCNKEELGLPPLLDQIVEVPLSAHTREVYEELRKKAVVEITNAAGQPTTVVARIVLTLLLRLHQITGGFARDVGEEVIDLSDEKAKAAMELTDDALAQGERVVIWARFLHDLDKLQAKLERSGYRWARLDGSVPSAERAQLLREHHAGRIDVLITQLRVGSVGIDLTGASVGIFYSTGYSLEDFLQARDRMHGPGQTRPVILYHLQATRTVDQAIYKALGAKTSLARAVTSLDYATNLFR